MANNRELSQLGSFIEVSDTTGNIGIATTVTPYVGIGTTNPTSKLTVVGDVLVSGVLTATSFTGTVFSASYADVAGVSTYAQIAGLSTTAITAGYASTAGISTVSQGLTGTPNITVGTITANSASFSGNVSIAGTLTYEDVTSVDSLGIVSARTGVLVGPPTSIGATISPNGDASFAGIVTAIGGFNLGIQSGGINVTTGVVTALNFVGAGNSFSYNAASKTVDINIGGGQWTYTDSLNVGESNIYRLNGNVGLGTTNPTSKIHVIGDSYISGVTTTALLNVGVGGTIITTTNTTRVGINSISPNFTLDVNGDLNFNGTLYQNNSEFIASRWTATSSGGDIYRLSNVGIGTTNPTERLQVNGQLSIDNNVSYGTTSVGIATTSQVGIHSTLATSTYRSVEYTIQATEGTNFHTTKIIVLHDGSTTYSTEYGSIFNNSEVSTYDVDISGGNIRLLATPASSSTTNFKITFNAIKV